MTILVYIKSPSKLKMEKQKKEKPVSGYFKTKLCYSKLRLYEIQIM